MADQLQDPVAASPVTQNDVESEAVTDSDGPSVSRIMIILIVAVVGVLLVGFIIALILALTNPGAAAGVQIIRDFFIIAMALEGMLIGAALILLVLQLARLTNLIQNEIKPILEQTEDTVKTVRGTAAFMSRNVADPVIRASGFFSWLMALLRELLGIRRAVRGGGERSTFEEEGES